MTTSQRRSRIPPGLVVVVALIAVPFGWRYAIGGGPFFKFQPVEVYVVDYDSEKPMPGAVVAARWLMTSGFSIHGEMIRGEAGTAEGVTNASGRVVLLPCQTRRRWNQFVSSEVPTIFVHKAGYVVGSKPPWDQTAGARKYYLLPPRAFADGAEAFADIAGAVSYETDHSSLYPLSHLPRIEREIRSGYRMLTPEMQLEVDRLVGAKAAWLHQAPSN